MNNETTMKLSSAYIALLMIPVTDSFRFNNQPIYAALRDAIAEMTGCSSEEVQNEHERIAHESLNEQGVE